MAVQLPKFEGSHCEGFRACAKLRTTDKKLIASLAHQKTITFRYRASGQMACLDLECGGEIGGKHLHVDLFTRSFFENAAKMPESTRSRKDFEKIIEQTMGVEIEVGITSFSAIPLESVDLDGPAGILTPIEVGDGIGTIRSTRFSLDFPEDIPLKEADCFLNEKADKLMVICDMIYSTKVGESYLVTILERIDWLTRKLFTKERDANSRN